MKRKAIIPLVLGLGIGLVTVKLAVDAIQRAQAASSNVKTVEVVRATRDIRAHEKITEEMVEVVQTVESLFTPAADRAEKTEVVVGRVAAKAIPERTPVLLSMLAPKGTRSGMVGRIPPGFRAVSVKIDEVTGVAYQLQPGDWVDVIVVMDVASSTLKRKETIAEVILQHVQVAAIGHATDSDPNAVGARVKPAKSATLLVPEREVPKLHLAGTRGKITLAMRGEDALTMENPPSANLDDVLNKRRASGPKVARASSSEIPLWMKAMGMGGGKASTPTPKIVPAESIEQERHGVIVFRGRPDDGERSVERITFAGSDSSSIVDVAIGPPSSPHMGGASRGKPTSNSGTAGNNSQPGSP